MRWDGDIGDLLYCYFVCSAEQAEQIPIWVGD